jgi:hypothetical protein
MVDEPTSDTYDDDALTEYIERYAVKDALGTEPWEYDFSTTPPTRSEDSNWMPTYDLHAAAADIWAEKASVIAEDYDFVGDGGNLKRSQKYEQYMKQSRYHFARKRAKTHRQWPEPRRTSTEENNSD